MYPLLIRASSDSGRHLDLSASGTRTLEVGPAPVYPIIYTTTGYSGRFEWVLHWAPSCIASLSHLIVPSIVPAWARWGGGGRNVCRPLGEKSEICHRQHCQSVVICPLASAAGSRIAIPHIATPCDAGLVHPTLTAPSFGPRARPNWLLATSLLVLYRWHPGSQSASLPVCQSALHFTHVPNPRWFSTNRVQMMWLLT